MSSMTSEVNIKIESDNDEQEPKLTAGQLKRLLGYYGMFHLSPYTFPLRIFAYTIKQLLNRR